MISQPQYLIVGGINGAGKSTLYETIPALFAGTKRLNADEILRRNGGNWRKFADNFKAMHEELVQLRNALAQGESVHVETTLAGQGKSQLKLIDQAHHQGFKVTLIYIALASDELAVKRVLSRFRKGGHGIPEATIKKRYPQSNQNLAAVAAKADNVFIFDNTNRFVLVYVSEQGQVIKNTLRQFPWINQGIQA